MPSLQLHGELSFYDFVINEESLWMSSCLLLPLKACWAAGGTAKFQLRPLKVITCYLFLLHHNPTLCLMLSLHVLCCLYFSFLGQMMWLWGICSIQQTLQTCWTHKIVSNLWGRDTWTPHKRTHIGLISVGERKPFLFWFDVYGAGFDRRHTSKKKCVTLKVIKELSVQCCGFSIFHFKAIAFKYTCYFQDPLTLAVLILVTNRGSFIIKRWSNPAAQYI